MDDVTASVIYIDEQENIKAVIETEEAVFDAVLNVGGRAYPDEFNLDEPYDRLAHVFRIDRSTLDSETPLRFSGRDIDGEPLADEFVFGSPDILDPAALAAEYDNGLTEEKTEEETIGKGVVFSHIYCTDSDGAPVHFHTLDVDMKSSTLYTGTPGDGYESRNVRATIPDMAQSAEKNGQTVLAAVNADFFDIYGDFHPAGLCVKNGRIIANPASPRPFIGVTRDGSAVLTTAAQSPDILSELQHAVSGLQLLLLDGELNDVAAGEPFGYVRHPRTAAGVRADGSVLIAEVDGRIPDYSNGASLTDLALFMKKHGCVRALNLDGGGSSAVYTRDGELKLRTIPADLFRPFDKLIREDFNCLLITRR